MAKGHTEEEYLDNLVEKYFINPNQILGPIMLKKRIEDMGGGPDYDFAKLLHRYHASSDDDKKNQLKTQMSEEIKDVTIPLLQKAYERINEGTLAILVMDKADNEEMKKKIGAIKNKKPGDVYIVTKTSQRTEENKSVLIIEEFSDTKDGFAKWTGCLLGNKTSGLENSRIAYFSHGPLIKNIMRVQVYKREDGKIRYRKINPVL